MINEPVDPPHPDQLAKLGHAEPVESGRGEPVGSGRGEPVESGYAEPGAPVESGRGEPDAPNPVTEVDLLRWSESLAGIARTGLAFTESLYEQERFQEVLGVAAEIKAHTGRGFDPSEQVTEWMGAVGRRTAGYVTPKSAVGAVVGNDAGEILLVQRADSGIWLYPTGWADIGYSPAEVAVKEVHEETGIECEPVRLLTVIDGFRAGFTRIPLYSLVFYCRATGGELKAHPLETLQVGFFGRDALPEPLAGIGDWVDEAFAAIDGDDGPTTFDSVRSSAWPDPPPVGTT